MCRFEFQIGEMADIRSFFGKKVEKKSNIPVIPPPTQTKRENEQALLDSDDDFIEELKPERKRLKSKSKKEIEPPQPVPVEINPPSAKRKATIDLSEDQDDGNGDSQSHTDSAPTLIALPPDESQNSTMTTAPTDSQTSDIFTPQSPLKILPTIPRKPEKIKTGSRVEIKGSVNSFFGEPEAPQPPPMPKKIQKVSHIVDLDDDDDEEGHEGHDEEEDEDDDSEEELPKKVLKGKSKSLPTKKGKSVPTPPPVVKIPTNIIIESIPPQGRENCLEGYKIAFTGAMGEYMSRSDLETMVLQYGGKVAQNISGKTTLLVASPLLEDGRDSTTSNKYRTAIDKKLKIITEREFLGVIQASITTPQKSVGTLSSSSSSTSTTTNGRSSSTSAVSRVVKSINSMIEKPLSSSSSTSATSSSASAAELSQLLWVDKYKPSRLEDVIGAAESIRKILDWLKKWPDVHLRKTVKIPFSKENPGGKSLLLSGPPGIGKTTLATLVAKSLGFEVLEFNASDVRSKNAIVSQVSDVVCSQALSSNGKLKKRLVIMDEVDGMGGSDRGGIPELIKVIKASSTPIICICNERQERKIRSLANHCFDIRLRRPTKKMIADRLVKIGQQEGLMIEPNAAELLVEQMGNDIRQVINASQMWRAQSTTMKYRDLAGSVGGVQPYVDSEEGDPGNESIGRLRGIQKDKILRQSPFDACGLILGGKKTDFNERYNSFFIDYSLMPLLVEQNYIDSSRNGIFKSHSTDANKLDQLSKAAETISDMDMAGSALRGQDLHWELLPLQAALSLKVGDHVQGFQGFPTFPQWLGKYSTTNKSKRLTQEIVVHTNLSIRQSFDPIRLDYIPYLRHHLISLLRNAGAGDGETSNGIEEVIHILDDYGLSRDDLMETMKEMQFLIDNDKNLFDRYGTLDTKLKTAFTKKYNSMEHRSQALIEEYQASKRKARSKVGGGEEFEDGEDIGTTEDLEAAKEIVDEKDSDDDEALKDFMKKHSKKSSSSSSSSGRRGQANETKTTTKRKK